MSTALRDLRLISFALLALACNDTRSNDDDPGTGDEAPDAAAPDATVSSEADWSCVGAETPAAPEQIAITGRVFNGSQEPIADAVIEVLAVADDAVITSGTSGADGTFALEVASEPEGLAAYLRATPEGRLTIYNYFDGPLLEDAEVPMLSLTGPELTAFYGFALQTAFDETKSTVSMVFKDCAAVPVAEVDISLDPEAEKIAYYSDAKQNVDNALTTTDQSGFAFGVNAPADAGGLPVTARGTAGEVVLEAELETHPGALVSILVRP